MRLGKRKLLGLVALVAAAAGSAAAWMLWGVVGLLAVVLAVCLGGTLLVAWYTLQSERRLRKEIVKVHSDLRAQRAADGTRLGQLFDEIGRLRESLIPPSEHAEQLLDALHAGFTRVEMVQDQLVGSLQSDTRELFERLLESAGDQREELRSSTAETRADLWRMFSQVEAIAALYATIRPDESLPPTREWAASPDLLLFLYDTIRKRRPRLVLECGSGASTVVMAYALRKNGTGRLVSLEHLSQYRDATKEWVAAHGLVDWVDVRLAPLTEVRIAGDIWPWYSISQVPDEEIDLVFVDGPPGTTRKQARFPALPILADRLAWGATVVLDDVRRGDEASVAERWAALYPDWQLARLAHEKGTVALVKATVVADSARTGESARNADLSDR